MGCWSADSFGNDDATDWLLELVDQQTLAPSETAIGIVLRVGNDYLEAPDASEALVAAEVIAAALGRPGVSAQKEETLMLWIEVAKPQPNPDLVAQSIQAIDRILAKDSELFELWSESDEFQDWINEVQDLRARLSA